MGWKTFYHVDEAFFKKLYDENKLWGELYTIKILIAGAEHYGAGVISSSPTPFMQSPKVVMVYGLLAKKARVKVKLYAVAGSNSEGVVSIGFVGYKDDATCKDEHGYDYHGASIALHNPATTAAFEDFELLVEVDGNIIKLSTNGTDLGAYRLDSAPQSFTIACRVESVAAGLVGVVVVGVSAEYYDLMEDVMAQMMSMMSAMMWAVLAVMVVSLIVSAVKGRKRGGE